MSRVSWSNPTENGSSGQTLRDTNVCEGIRVGDEVEFEVTLENTHCVDKRDFLLRIGPSGLDESLLVDVKVLCDCDCENEVYSFVSFSKKYSGQNCKEC